MSSMQVYMHTTCIQTSMDMQWCRWVEYDALNSSSLTRRKPHIATACRTRQDRSFGYAVDEAPDDKTLHRDTPPSSPFFRGRRSPEALHTQAAAKGRDAGSTAIFRPQFVDARAIQALLMPSRSGVSAETANASAVRCLSSGEVVW